MAWWTRALVAAALAVRAVLADAQEATFASYREDAGLGNLTVRSLVQDFRGVLWIGTENGLYRFDGFSIRREPTPAEAGPQVLEVKVDDAGRLWLGTAHGLYVGVAAQVGPGLLWRRADKPAGGALAVDGMQRLAGDGRGGVVVMDRGNTLWTVDGSPREPGRVAARPLSVGRFPPSAGTFETDSGPVVVAGQAVWFGCGQALCQSVEGRLRTWGVGDGLPARSWANLLRSRDGGIWARSDGMLAHLAPGATRFEAIAAPPRSTWPGEIALVEDPQGRILTAMDGGVARWDGRAWRRWTAREGMPGTEVRSLFFDSSGSLWLGAAGRGLYRWIGYGQVEHWTDASGLPSAVVWGLARDGAGRLLAATTRGVAMLDDRGQRFRALAPAGAQAQVVTELAADADGVVWWMEGPQLMAMGPRDEVARAVRAEPDIEKVMPGPGGPYLVGRDRLSHLRPDGRATALPAGLPDPASLVDVLEDGPTHWFLANDGAWRLEGGRWLPLRDAATGQPILIDNGATFRAPGELWATSRGAVVVYRVERGAARRLRSFPSSTFGDAAQVLLRSDRRGGVWLGTDQGCFVFADDRWHHLDRGNALVWNDVDGPGLLADPDGTVWISTSAGLSRLGDTRPWPPPPRLRIDELDFGGRAATLPRKAPIPWAERSVRVTVGTPDLDVSRTTAVEYRLDPATAWQRIDDNVVRLDALGAGSYRLQLRASASPGSGMAGPTVEVPFEIAPPWWWSRAAFAAYLAALAIAWWGSTHALRRRSRAMQRSLEAAIAQRTEELERSQAALLQLGEHNARALEDERTRVSRELHDELGQQLAAMRMEVSVLRIRATGGAAIDRPDLDVLLERVDRLVASVRQLVTGMRPPALDGGLPAALEWLVAELRRGSSVQCTLTCDAAAATLAQDVATMMFRIAQESLTNVRKHAHATHVTVSLSRQSGDWVLAIEDDGEGFDPSRPGGGFGLLGMKERARALGAALSIDSGSSRGTRIRLRVPAAAGRPGHRSPGAASDSRPVTP